MSKHRVLCFKPQLRLEGRGQDGRNEPEQPDHSASLDDSITASTRIRFSVHTIYKWRDRYRSGESNALRCRGRTTKAERAAHEGTLIAEKQPAKEARRASLEELARSQRRIAALERKIGQQQVELDFFQQALRQVRGQRLRSGVPGETASTKSSKR